jgi:hypothetical protein
VAVFGILPLSTEYFLYSEISISLSWLAQNLPKVYGFSTGEIGE